jgi:hypothetical protein
VAGEPPAQQRRRDEGGGEHHQQQGAEGVAVDHPQAQADAREHQADLAARQHAEAHQGQVHALAGDHAGRHLADHRRDQQQPGEGQRPRPQQHRRLGVDADLQEEHGHEHVRDRRQAGADRGARAAARQHHAGDEGADDRGETDQFGQARERQREGERERDQGAVRARQPLDPGEQQRRQPHAGDHPDDQEADGGADHQQQPGEVDRAAGDQPHHHREDHQPDDVVGDRGAEHRAGLRPRQRLEVAEDPGGHADAGGGQGRAQEQLDVVAVPGQPGEAQAEVAQGERQRHPDRRHRERRAPHPQQLGQLGLEPDLEEQQQHAQLAEDREDLVAADQPEGGRADQHADDQLAEHGGLAETLRQLGTHLGCDQDDQDVQQDGADIQKGESPPG